MTDTTSPSPTADQHDDSPRGLLQGDRLCIECNYNLIGQTIRREPHYGLFVVRCPECGAVAATQEYPLLGKWAGRIGMLAAAFWFAVVIALFTGTAGVTTGFNIAFTEQVSRNYQDDVSNRIEAWIETNAPDLSGGQAFQAWWQTTNPAQLRAESPAWWRVADPEDFFFMGVSWFLMLVSGLVLGTVLFHRKWRGLLASVAIIAAIAAAFSSFAFVDWAARTQSPTSVWHLRGVWASHLLVVEFVAQMTWLYLGMLIGRPLARLVLRLLLPPRLRSGLALLWLCDGLDPPTTDTRRATTRA